ncbi:hypothetical protein PPL_00783 [Heterostelium album PN500]|uniref:Uncharacterized protein n=1 Tax=Heterostelium pallidum (strain ATCC 26659 / Pp 5 / PN500) TaxID=670386 RepID=D3AXF2_HETP5|nr:hypothetical protein PPL_00783 [Heterostelium album PN500]EFA86221.1 hypothetical protein PPL_00783 [Heterostelium album PN500]|eukprot:XP_020438326.1 hypothetical protein PPL_00783 [Heterostelium album PN500]
MDMFCCVTGAGTLDKRARCRGYLNDITNIALSLCLDITSERMEHHPSQVIVL